MNTEALPALGERFAIRSIPTVMVFRDGSLLASLPGMMPAPQLEDLIAQVRALYDGALRSIDDQLGVIFARLRASA